MQSKPVEGVPPDLGATAGQIIFRLLRSDERILGDLVDYQGRHAETTVLFDEDLCSVIEHVV
jgi:hypothetical protein